MASHAIVDVAFAKSSVEEEEPSPEENPLHAMVCFVLDLYVAGVFVLRSVVRLPSPAWSLRFRAVETGEQGLLRAHRALALEPSYEKFKQVFVGIDANGRDEV